MFLGQLEMALNMQRVKNTNKGCAMFFIFLVKNESMLYILGPHNLRRIANLYDMKQETECVTAKPKGTDMLDKILSTDRNWFVQIFVCM